MQDKFQITHYFAENTRAICVLFMSTAVVNMVSVNILNESACFQCFAHNYYLYLRSCFPF